MNLILLVIIGFLSISVSAEEQLALEYTNLCQVYSGYFQDQNNCRCFYQCDTEYRLWHGCCPDGQLFDEKIRACISGNLMVCDNRQSMRAVRQNPVPNCYVPNGLFRHENCAKFWHCSHSYLYEMSCPEGTLWNDALKTCVLPQYSTCNALASSPVRTYSINTIIKSPDDFTYPNQPYQQASDRDFNNIYRARFGGQVDEQQLNEQLTETLINDKRLSSLTYITLDPTGRIVYGITKISKFTLGRVNPNEVYNKSTENSTPVNTETTQQVDESDLESPSEQSYIEESNENNKDLPIESDESVVQSPENSTDNSTESENKTTLNIETSETTTESFNKVTSDTTESVESQTGSTTNSVTVGIISSTEKLSEGSFNTTVDTSSPSESDDSFTDRPENSTFSEEELLKDLENIKLETIATEKSVTENTNDSTDESTTSIAQVPEEITTESSEPEKIVSETNTSSGDSTESIESSTEISGESVTESMEPTEFGKITTETNTNSGDSTESIESSTEISGESVTESMEPTELGKITTETNTNSEDSTESIESSTKISGGSVTESMEPTEFGKITTETNTNSGDSTESIDSSTENSSKAITDSSIEADITSESSDNESHNNETTTEVGESLESTTTGSHKITGESDEDFSNNESTTESPQINIESVTQTNEMSNYSNTEFDESLISGEVTTKLPQEKSTEKSVSESGENITTNETESSDSSDTTTTSTKESSEITSKPEGDEESTENDSITTTEPPEGSTDSFTSESSPPDTTKLTPTDNKTTLKPEAGFELPTPNYDICKEAGGYYADENDCRCFYVCDLLYRPYRHCCPDGLLFNENAEELLCDHPDSVICRDGSNRPLRLKRSIHYKHNVKKVILNHLKLN